MRIYKEWCQQRRNENDLGSQEKARILYEILKEKAESGHYVNILSEDEVDEYSITSINNYRMYTLQAACIKQAQAKYVASIVGTEMTPIEPEHPMFEEMLMHFE